MLSEIKVLSKDDFVNLYIDDLESENKLSIYYNPFKDPLMADHCYIMTMVYFESIVPFIVFGFDGSIIEGIVQCVDYNYKNVSDEVKTMLLSELYDKLIPEYASEIYTKNETELLEQRCKQFK